MKTVGKSIRFINFLIDLVIISITTIVITLFDDSYTGKERLLIFIVMFGYYFVIESFTKQSVGKMVTNTKVVMRDGSTPSVVRILMRSLLRIVPFDSLSYLFGKHHGLHDLLSGTQVVFIDHDEDITDSE